MKCNIITYSKRLFWLHTFQVLNRASHHCDWYPCSITQKADPWDILRGFFFKYQIEKNKDIIGEMGSDTINSSELPNVRHYSGGVRQLCYHDNIVPAIKTTDILGCRSHK
jgi:hypothetical protein